METSVSICSSDSVNDSGNTLLSRRMAIRDNIPILKLYTNSKSLSKILATTETASL
ncbi:hypothetical protein D3C71_2003810 [compost metagenome]